MDFEELSALSSINKLKLARRQLKKKGDSPYLIELLDKRIKDMQQKHLIEANEAAKKRIVPKILKVDK